MTVLITLEDKYITLQKYRHKYTYKNLQTFACDKCEKVLPTATALKYHTCADVSSLYWINKRALT